MSAWNEWWNVFKFKFEKWPFWTFDCVIYSLNFETWNRSRESSCSKLSGTSSCVQNNKVFYKKRHFKARLFYGGRSATMLTGSNTIRGSKNIFRRLSEWKTHFYKPFPCPNGLEKILACSKILAESKNKVFVGIGVQIKNGRAPRSNCHRVSRSPTSSNHLRPHPPLMHHFLTQSYCHQMHLLIH